MGSINLKHTGSGSAIALSSDGTSLLLNGTAIGGGGTSSIDDLSDGYYDSKENLAFGDNTSTIFANIDLTDTQGAKRNVAIGYGHLGYVTSGQFNIALGNNCLVFNETGSYNTAIGQNALQQANVDRGTGDQNVGIGRFAGSYNSTGSSNTFLGHNTNTVIRGGSNQTAVGFDAKVGATGATAITNSRASGTDSFAAQITNNTTSYGASGVNSISMGYLSKTTVGRGVAIGYGARSTSSGLAIGSYALASGSGSIAISGEPSGYKTEASGPNSVAIGNRALAATIGKMAYTQTIFNANGDAQKGTFVLLADTTDATAEVLTTNGYTPAAWYQNQVILPNDSCYGFTGTVIAREDSDATNDFAVWEIKGGAVRAGSASTTALGSYNINKISESTGATNWSIALSADTTNGAVAITVTGEASHNIRWVATVNTTEVTY